MVLSRIFHDKEQNLLSRLGFCSWVLGNITTCLIHIVMQIQDGVIISDAERLRVTQSNVKTVLPASPFLLPGAM